jgi:polygalacturonase
MTHSPGSSGRAPSFIFARRSLQQFRFDNGAAEKYSAPVPVNATRRDFLRATTVAGAFGLTRLASAAVSDPWDQVPGILARIKAPQFPARDFDIAKYGAKGDGKTDSTAAIAQAIAECSRAGGGRVVVPGGVFSTAAIRLLSNVNLHVPAGSTLLFVQDPARYLPLVATRFEGIELMNYSPFIYADGQQNIAITGEGTLDGNADDTHWWPWKGSAGSRRTLFDMGEKGVPLAQRLFGEGHTLRPAFIQPCRSRNVLIEGVTIVRSPMWEVTPYDCSNVIIRGVKIVSHGPNNDGCDPDSCRDVLIENCSFDTGDDCIAIKSGRDRDGRQLAKPTENVIIRNCEMKDGHGAITIGSEMSGSVRNVYVENCRLSSPRLNQALRFKTNAQRGGTIENVFFRNIDVGDVSDSVLQIDFYYDTGDKGPERPVVRNIEVSNLTAKKAKYALFMKGFPGAHIRDVRLTDCSITGVAEENVVENVDGLAMNRVKIVRRL